MLDTFFEWNLIMDRIAQKEESFSGLSQPFARALNLVHLARQSAGDVALERELLTLFGQQSRVILAQISKDSVAQNASQFAELVHRLRGSALAVGAECVAEAAEACEAHLNTAKSADANAPCFAALGEAVARADEVIDALLAA